MKWDFFITESLANQMFAQAGLVAVMALMVLFATFIDLGSAIKASRHVGSFKTHSFGLRRTFRKLLEYLSVMILFLFIDYGLLFLSTASETIGFLKVLQIPLVSIVMFIAIMATEIQSVRENIEIRKGSGIIPDKTINMLAAMIEKIGDSGNRIDAKSIAEMLKVATKDESHKTKKNNG